MEPNTFYGEPLQGSIDCGCSSLGALIIKRLQQNGRKVAFIDQVSGRTTTFDQVLINSRKIARFLQQRYGVGKGSIVAISSENCVEYPIVVCAVTYLNATLVLLNPAYTSTELDHVLKLTRPKVAFASAKALKALQDFKHFIGTIVSFENLVDLPTLSEQEFIVPSPAAKFRLRSWCYNQRRGKR